MWKSRGQAGGRVQLCKWVKEASREVKGPLIEHTELCNAAARPRGVRRVLEAGASLFAAGASAASCGLLSPGTPPPPQAGQLRGVGLLSKVFVNRHPLVLCLARHSLRELLFNCKGMCSACLGPRRGASRVGEAAPALPSRLCVWPTHTAWTCVLVGPVGSVAHRTVRGLEGSIYWVCQVPGPGLAFSFYSPLGHS